MMAVSKRFLAFDLGAESGRAVVGSLSDSAIDLEEIHRFPTGGTDVLGTLHWDVLNFYNNMREGLSAYVQKFGRDLTGIGIDTWGVDFGLFDSNGALVANPVHYRDSRTEGIFDEAFRRMPREEVFKRTGIQFMPFNTVFQLLSMVVQRSPLLPVTKRLLLMPGIFNYFLTGIQVAEFTHATTTQMYDPNKGEWSIDIVSAMEIPSRILPDIIQPGTVIGRLRDKVAEEAGLGMAQVIAPACHDTGSAVAAVPAEKGDNWAYLSSGTWSLMGVELNEPIINDESLRFNVTNEGGVGGTFRFLKNISGLWMVQECRRIWARQGDERSYEQLAAEASEAKPFVALVNPDDPRFLKPEDMPQEMAAFCKETGQTTPSNRGEFVRCALESLALKYRDVLAKISGITGRKIEVLHIVGGGSRNRLLNQFTADATGVRVVAGPAEATALGNVMVQAMATGDLGSHAEGRALIRGSAELETFEPQDTDRWDEASERYRKIAE
jgi:rhamnulokinase